jgi:hypothetical protein
MAFYRCYLLNSEQHIVKAWSLETDDEDEVVSGALIARDKSTLPIVEVWLDGRCMYRDDWEEGIAARAR